MRAALQAARAAFCLVFLSVLFPALSSTVDRQPLDEALLWVRHSPNRLVQYDYLMTARVHFLFFWVGKDDVGGGYIRRGVSAADPHQEFFEVLFGSDPQKAPRAINRWGAGTEVSWHQSPVGTAPADDVTASAFFGFMKSSQGKSAAEMQSELEREKRQGRHSFTGILSRVEPARALSLVVPFESETDYSLRDYDRAEPLMLERLGDSARPVRSLEDSRRCSRSAEFLATVSELMDSAVAGRLAPQSRCYVYDAQENTLTLEKTLPVLALPVRLHGPNDAVVLDTAYKNLLQLDFVSAHKRTGKKVYFTIFVGQQGALRGVPVEICYQPNWWFEVVLYLQPEKNSTRNSTAASG